MACFTIDTCSATPAVDQKFLTSITLNLYGHIFSDTPASFVQVLVQIAQYVCADAPVYSF